MLIDKTPHVHVDTAVGSMKLGVEMGGWGRENSVRERRGGVKYRFGEFSFF